MRPEGKVGLLIHQDGLLRYQFLEVFFVIVYGPWVFKMRNIALTRLELGAATEAV